MGVLVKKKISIIAVLALLGVPTLAGQGSVGAQPVDLVDNMPGQASQDLSGTTDPNNPNGLWADAPGGVAGRPYIKSLTIINGATSTPMISNGTATTPESSTVGAITAVISPYNLCKPGVAPAPGKCYASPNRLGMRLGFVRGQGSIGTDFSTPLDSSGNALTLAAPMTNETIVDMVINMNTWGKTLRWTWLNGIPLGWKISAPGTADTDVNLKFQLQTGPSQVCTSAIPVEPCDPVQAAKNYTTRPFAPVKMLKGDFIFSLDETGVGPELSGALFASVDADGGSLETIPLNSPKLGLTYGVGGQSEIGGAPNKGRFFAFISDQSMTNYFGVSQEVLDSADFISSDLMQVTRADGGAQGAAGWNRTSADVFGTSGYLLSVNDIQFSGNVVSSQGVRALAQTAKSNPAKWKVAPKVSASVQVAKSGKNQRITARATTSACKGKTCRWVISKTNGVNSAGTTKLQTVTVKARTNTVSSVITAKATKGTRLSVLLQLKKGSKWKYVTSRLVTAK